MNVDSSPFLVNLVSRSGVISIVPRAAYGLSAACWGVSGAGNGSMRPIRTVLVLSSPFHRSGTSTVFLITDILGAGAFFGGFSGDGSLTTTYTS